MILKKVSGTRKSNMALSIERLESRVLLSTISVVNTLDSGAGSLRDAIVQANSDVAHDNIEFDIPGVGPHVIAPSSSLPSITNPLTINGYTQTGASPNTDQNTSNAVIMIELDGSNAGSSSGLALATSGSTIRGLAIHSFAGPNGIAVVGDGNVIEGNFIGTDASGTAVGLGNGENGIAISNASSNRIGTDADGVNDLGERNVIVDHGGGLRINNVSQFNVVAGNFLGVDASGNSAIANHTGVLLFDDASDNTVGGVGVARNVISGNTTHGVTIGASGFSSHNNIVQGNFIGTDSTGQDAIPNGFNGINVGSSSVNNQIVSNVISGNGRHGILIDKVGSNGTQIVGNLIGTNASGTAAIGNTGIGVNVSFGPAATEIRDNVISGNGSGGITLKGTSTDFHLSSIVTGNTIGAGVDPTLALPNGGAGVVVGNAADNRIGTDADGSNDVTEANLIAFNQNAGVLVTDSGDNVTYGNTIRGNSIHSNGSLGIDLTETSEGVTANDDDDLDTGSNSLQNYPVVSFAESGNSTRIVGSMDGQPNVTVAIDFYASGTADLSGFGEGEQYLGSTTVLTDGSGVAHYDVVLATSTTVGESMTATATNVATGDTSEFSASVASTAPPVIQVEFDVKPGNDGNPLNVASNGTLPVAILTTQDFDAANVDATTVIFAGAFVDHYALEDVDGDGDLDLLMHFRTNETQLEQVYSDLLENDVDEDGILDSTNQLAEVSLSGETFDEVLIEGTDQMDLFLRGRALRELVDDLFGS